MKLTYYGHSSFSVLVAGRHLLFDPFITGNSLAKHISIEDIPADYIFVSHGHFDHLLDVIPIARRTDATILVGWELCNYFNEEGGVKTQPINPGGKVSLDFGLVKSFTAQHSSSFQNGSYAGVATGFALRTSDGNFYYSGDTALTLDMSLVAKWSPLDYAVLPIGDTLTMGVEDAIAAALLVQVKHVVGVHYDTFPAIAIDKKGAVQAFERSGLTLHLPGPGKAIELGITER